MVDEADIPKFDFTNVSDSCIKELLAGQNPECRELGLIFLDTMKAEGFCGSLRRKNREKEYRLESAEITKIWEATMRSIRLAVRAGNFKRDGSLNSYVGTIMRRRTADHLRRRLPMSPGINVHVVAQPKDKDSDLRYDEPHETPKDIFTRKILDRLSVLTEEELPLELDKISESEMSDKEKYVMTHYLRLYKTHQLKPSDDELIASIDDEKDKNQQPRLTEDSIKSAKARAFKKLRGQGELKSD